MYSYLYTCTQLILLHLTPAQVPKAVSSEVLPEKTSLQQVFPPHRMCISSQSVKMHPRLTCLITLVVETAFPPYAPHFGQAFDIYWYPQDNLRERHCSLHFPPGQIWSLETLKKFQRRSGRARIQVPADHHAQALSEWAAVPGTGNARVSHKPSILPEYLWQSVQ